MHVTKVLDLATTSGEEVDPELEEAADRAFCAKKAAKATVGMPIRSYLDLGATGRSQLALKYNKH